MSANRLRRNTQSQPLRVDQIARLLHDNCDSEEDIDDPESSSGSDFVTSENENSDSDGSVEVQVHENDEGRMGNGDEFVENGEEGLGNGDGDMDITSNGPGDWHDFVGKQRLIPFIGKEEVNLPFDSESATPADFISLFWIDDLISYMVEETNRNAQQVISQSMLKRSSRYNEWDPTTSEEMKKFLALRLWMGLMPLPSYPDYWSNSLLYKNYIARTIMTRKRFEMLVRFWHFSNNDDEGQGRIHKIQRLVDKLVAKFKERKTPGMKIAVDESIVPWRGRLVFRQYLPGKSHKYGIKVFKVCDDSGYTYGWIIYSGKGTFCSTSESMPTRVVKELVDDYLDCGRVICTDNFYTSPALCSYLLERNSHFVGTLRKNRKGLPPLVVNAKLRKNELKVQENDAGMVVVKWRDQRDVLLLSSVYGPDLVPTGKHTRKGDIIRKPEIIVEYNKAKGGIDISDTLASYHSVQRKSLRGYHKVADDLLFGTSIVNAFLLYVSTTGKQMHLKTFRGMIVKNFLEVPDDLIQRTPLPTNHYLKEEKSTQGKDSRKKRRRCKQCYINLKKQFGNFEAAKKCKQVPTFCATCPDKPFLCVDCFERFHKKSR